MPDNPPEPRSQSTADLDAGWGELLDGIGHSHPVELAPATPAPAEPVPVDEQDPRELDVAQKKSANEMLAQMARMLDVGEGTGPVVDLRRVLAPTVEGTPISAPTSAPAPLIPPRVIVPEPELETVQSEVETPPALDKLPAPSERTVVTKRPRDDAPLLLELGDDGPRPIDARDDAPRLLAVSDGVPQPIVEGEESWPRRETPRTKTRTAETSTASQRLPKVEPTGPIARVADTGPRPTARAARSQWPWIAGAAALVIAVGWAVLRPSTPSSGDVAQASAAGQHASRKGDAAAAATIADPRPATAAIRSGDEKVAVVAPKAKNAAKEDPPIEASAKPVSDAKPEPVADAKPEPVADAKPEPVADAKPVKAAASTASITGTPEELLAAADAALAEKRFEDAHALARRSWDAAHDNVSVRVMAIAACELQDGALARSAFRKLKGPDVRAEVFAVCRTRAVDVRSNVDGYTPAELVVKATRALEQGEYEQAYEFAKSSNKLKHTSAAMAIMATAACHKHDADEAVHLSGMLPKARKQEVLDACKAAGTALP